MISNTSSYFPDKTAWNDRLGLVREKGVAAFAGANVERWFTKGFRERAPEAVAWMAKMFAGTPLEGYIACGEAVRDMDHRELLPRISAPTLVIAGKHDPATPLEAGEYIRSRVPGATLTVLDAAHISNVEQPEAYADAVLKFLLAGRREAGSAFGHPNQASFGIVLATIASTMPQFSLLAMARVRTMLARRIDRAVPRSCKNRVSMPPDDAARFLAGHHEVRAESEMTASSGARGPSLQASNGAGGADVALSSNTPRVSIRRAPS